jgi:hypothetical protein
MTVVSSSSRINVKVNKKNTVLVNQSKLVIRSLNDLIDVDTSAKTDGSILIYDEEQKKFVATTLLEKQEINGGFF